MTNDEAVAWCSGKEVKVVFTPGALVQVQAAMTTPRMAKFLQVRATFVEAVADIKTKWEAVEAGTLSPADSSLASAQFPGRVQGTPFAPSAASEVVEGLQASLRALIPSQPD